MVLIILQSWTLPTRVPFKHIPCGKSFTLIPRLPEHPCWAALARLSQASLLDSNSPVSIVSLGPS